MHKLIEFMKNPAFPAEWENLLFFQMLLKVDSFMSNNGVHQFSRTPFLSFTILFFFFIVFFFWSIGEDDIYFRLWSLFRHMWWVKVIVRRGWKMFSTNAQRIQLPFHGIYQTSIFISLQRLLAARVFDTRFCNFFLYIYIAKK